MSSGCPYPTEISAATEMNNLGDAAGSAAGSISLSTGSQGVIWLRRP